MCGRLSRSVGGFREYLLDSTCRLALVSWWWCVGECMLHQGIRPLIFCLLVAGLLTRLVCIGACARCLCMQTQCTRVYQAGMGGHHHRAIAAAAPWPSVQSMATTVLCANGSAGTLIIVCVYWGYPSLHCLWLLPMPVPIKLASVLASCVCALRFLCVLCIEYWCACRVQYTFTVTFGPGLCLEDRCLHFQHFASIAVYRVAEKLWADADVGAQVPTLCPPFLQPNSTCMLFWTSDLISSRCHHMILRRSGVTALMLCRLRLPGFSHMWLMAVRETEPMQQCKVYALDSCSAMQGVAM